MRVWNHLDKNDLRKALREVKRVLKPEGHLIFDAEEKSFLRRFVSFFYKRIFRTTGYVIYQYSLEEIKKMLREEKFIIEKGKYLNHKIGRQMVFRIRSV